MNTDKRFIYGNLLYKKLEIQDKLSKVMDKSIEEILKRHLSRIETSIDLTGIQEPKIPPNSVRYILEE